MKGNTMSSSHDIIIHIMIEDKTSSSQNFSTREPSSGQSDETQEALHTEESGLENFRTDSTSSTFDSEDQ